MPKKFAGENSKAVQARARKAASKEAEHSKKQKEIEDSLWKDDDKHIAKKLQRKEETDRKKQQQLEKKAEAKALLEKEMGSIQPAGVGKQPAAKVTRAQIQAETERRNAAAAKAVGGVVVDKLPKLKTHIDQPLEENINRLQPDEIATTIDEAIKMLSVGDAATDDKHPEKRLKAAYLAFEEKNMPLMKAENPSLRMSQLKQMIFKEWQKSSENPLNKPKSQ